MVLANNLSMPRFFFASLRIRLILLVLLSLLPGLALTHNLTELGWVTLWVLVVAWFGSDLIILRHVNALVATTQRQATDMADNQGELKQLTVRQSAEEELREREKRDRLLVELSPETTLVHSDGKIVYINPAGMRLLGATTPDALIGKPILEMVHLAYQETVQASIENIQQENQPPTLTEIQMVRGDGQIIDVEAIAVQIVYQGKLAVQVGIRDITERKRAQTALQQTTSLKRAILNSANYTIISTTVDGIILTFNKAAELWLGYTAAEVVGKTTPVIIHDSDEVEQRAQELSQELGVTIEPGFEVFVAKARRGEVEEREWSFIGKDGTRFPVLLSVTAMRDTEGNITGFLGLGSDITARKRIEEALSESEERFRIMADTAPVLIWMAGRDKLCYFFNQGWLDFTGRTLEEERGNGWVDGVHPEDFRGCLDTSALAFDAQQMFTREYRLRRFDGKYRWILDTGIPRYTPDGSFVGYIGTCIDITERKQAEAELQSQAQLLDLAHDTIMVRDVNNRLTFWNQGAVQMYGYSKAEALGQHVYTLLQTQFPLNLEDIEAQLLRFGCWEGELVNTRRDGSLVVVATRWALQRDEYGAPVKILEINNNITERKRTEVALEQLQHQNQLILNSAGEGICGVDSIGNITFINPAGAKMLGYGVEELLNQPIHTLLCQSNGTAHTLEDTVLYTVLQEGTVQKYKDQVFWRKDGSSFSVEYLATPIADSATGCSSAQFGLVEENLSDSHNNSFTQNSVVGAVLTFRDITQRLAVEQMKDEFISVVSHELRTPLTSIRGALGLIAGGLLTTQPEKAQRMLEIAAANTDRLARLINDILDIERIESGKVQMEKEVCDVQDLIVQTADDMQAIAEKADVTLVVTPVETGNLSPLQVLADRDRLVQVLTNLISNAIKFSPPDTKIEVSAEVGELGTEALLIPNSQSPTVLFKVKDQGRGIPADKLETIFGRFQQVNSSDSRDKGGTGLGLAICRSIVQQHGGRIWAESQLDEGSTFYFTLPAPPTLASSEVLVLNSESEDSIQDSRLNIQHSPLVLLCDDETSIHPIVKVILENRGYRVIAVDSGEEAIKQAIQLQPSVILLDLMMPGMDGWETMAALKEQPNTKNIPIIILSALALEKRESSNPDVVGWVSKPATDQALFEIIEQSLKQRAKVTRILVVEDDLDLARVLTTMFDRYGLEAYHAQTGQQAIQLSQRVLPDLLLLDLVLPQGDGYVVVEWLRLHDRLRKVPLVVYSARDLNKTERDRLLLGPTEFFTKGRITPEDFEERVIALLHRILSKS